MSTYTLPRTGQAALTFEGDELASVGGRWSAGQDQNRYHNLAVYHTTGGKYVLQITYCTQWQGEQAYDQVVVLGQDPSGLAEALREYDPCASVQGYPPGAQYADRQQRLLEALRARYEAQVSELLGKVPGTAERLD